MFGLGRRLFVFIHMQNNRKLSLSTCQNNQKLYCFACTSNHNIHCNLQVCLVFVCLASILFAIWWPFSTLWVIVLANCAHGYGWQVLTVQKAYSNQFESFEFVFVGPLVSFSFLYFRSIQTELFEISTATERWWGQRRDDESNGDMMRPKKWLSRNTKPW